MVVLAGEMANDLSRLRAHKTQLLFCQVSAWAGPRNSAKKWQLHIASAQQVEPRIVEGSGMDRNCRVQRRLRAAAAS